MRRKRKEKMTRKQRRIRNRITFRTLFLLSITLIFNTYAWFLYANVVSANLVAQVDAWHVEFQVESQQVDREFIFNVDHAYPGMTNQVKTVTITNTGDKVADLSYEIKSARFFNEIYVSQEAVAEGLTVPQGATVLTKAQLLSKVQNDYPFHLAFTTTSNTIAVNASANLTMQFSWMYDSGDDTTDTYYGTTAYTYNSANSNSPSIEIVIAITAAQQQET